MLQGETRVELARLRMALRAIDGEIAGIREESRRYRQMNFGLDIKEIQLTALMDQRGACLKRLGELEQELQLPVRRESPFRWLLLPLGLWLNFQKPPAPALLGSRATATEKRRYSRERVAVA